jgi:enoyl-CoA hydratase/carnithine racemase
MNDLVTRTDVDGISTLTLNRPESLNALSPALFVELRSHLEAIAAASAEVGCVVLTGAGRSFSAGNDIKAIQAGDRAPSPHFQAETIDFIEAMPQPVIASVRGHCYTGALEVVLACDLLVCGASARLADTHGRWAMTPTWGMSQRLPRRIGPTRAKMLMLTGQPITGEQAVTLGLANLCVPDEDLDAKTLELARTITANSWHTLQADKRLVNEGRRYSLPDALAYERRTSPGAGPDMAERLQGFGGRS